MSGDNESSYNIFKHGSAWLRADFHLHTKADKEFNYNDDENYYFSNYVDRLVETGIRIAVITNHNKFDKEEFISLKKTAIKKEIYLLPGVELSVNDGANGIHLIVVFSEEWLENGKDYINPFIATMFPGKSSDEYQNENGRSDKNLLQVTEEIEKTSRDYFFIFAHVEDPKGLWDEMKGGKIADFLDPRYDKVRESSVAFQKVRTRARKEQVKQWLKDWYVAEVEGTDNKTIDEIGTREPVYIKIGNYSFEAVKYALKDYHNRVRSEVFKHKKSYIKSISFSGGVLSGKEIPLSPELNTIIGIRGSGKSSIIESIRYVLDITFSEQDREYKGKLIPHTLGSGGMINIFAVDPFGNEYEVRRILNEQPEVLRNGILQPGVSVKESVLYKPVYFGQKDLSSSGEDFERELVEKLIGEKINEIRLRIEEQKKRVQDAVRRYLKLSDIDDKIIEYKEKKQNADHQLLKYKEFKIEQQMQKQLDFDTDIRVCQQSIKNVNEFISSLNDVLNSNEDDLVNAVNYKSKQNAPFFNDFFHTYKIVLSSFENIRKSSGEIKDAFNKLKIKSDELDNIRKRFKEEFAEIERKLSEQLKSAGMTAIRPDDFKQIAKTSENAASMLKELEKEKAKSEQVKNDLLSEMSALNSLWREEWEAVKIELNKVNTNHPSLEIKNEYKGGKDSFIQFMKEIFKGSKIRETHFEKIAEDYQDFHELFKSQEKAKKILGANYSAFENYFTDNLEVLLVWQKPDKIAIEYRGKELKDHSLGQRASALILFVLSQKENDVIIIDQPEDDLDNQTIYQDVIKLIKEIKPETQFILATHNPNIPVLGDAEQVISCTYSNEIITLKMGSIDRQLIQNEIVSIMEGGEEAFNKRKEIYRIWKPQN